MYVFGSKTTLNFTDNIFSLMTNFGNMYLISEN